jgi:tRNA(fMet)-specific endonuclease VapC
MERSGMVIDTSIFIEFLRAKDKTKTVLFQIPEADHFYISSVTLYELLIGANTPEIAMSNKFVTNRNDYSHGVFHVTR